MLETRKKEEKAHTETCKAANTNSDTAHVLLCTLPAKISSTRSHGKRCTALGAKREDDEEEGTHKNDVEFK